MLTLGTSPAIAQLEQPAPAAPSEQRLQDQASALIVRTMNTCWRMPTDLPDSQRLIVTVRFNLRPDGTLESPPQVVSPRNYQFDPNMLEAANRALLAVRRCAPYPMATDQVLKDHYELWHQLEFTFIAAR